jgi:nucleotide-binding universal stress UspA family protein
MNFYLIKRILVALDLSETSLNALDTAVLLARQHKATLLLLNVSETLPETMDDKSKLQLQNQASPDVLSALTTSMNHTYGIKARLINREGNVVETIINTAVTEYCDLVIMGTHGASGLRDGFIGSNTYNVIKYSACPVLTIPPHKKVTTFKKILFPIRPVAGALMRYDVVSRFLTPNSILDVLGVSNLSMERETGVLNKIAAEVNEQFNADKVQVNTVWGTGNSVSEDILEFAQNHHPQLIVLTSVLDAVNKPNFIGPHTQKIIHCAKIPLLNIKKIGVPAFA